MEALVAANSNSSHARMVRMRRPPAICNATAIGGLETAKYFLLNFSLWLRSHCLTAADRIGKDSQHLLLRNRRTGTLSRERAKPTLAF